MIAGLVYAVSTCVLWALSFVSPVILREFSAYSVTLGRYAVFCLFSLAIAPFALRHLRTLQPADWARAASLAVVGHMAYYLFLATAIQWSGVPGPTVVIGLLPLTVPIFANLHKRELPWRPLFAPLAGIAAGLFLVHADELQRIDAHDEGVRYAVGIGFALAALACWTWYGVANANWLRSRSQVTSTGWTMAQGIALFPVVVVATIGVSATEVDAVMRNATSEQWRLFLLVSCLVGVGSTWLATLCWSQASRLLPTTLAGQLIVVVTISAVICNSVYRGALPTIPVIAGVVLLAGAVAFGVRAIQRRLASAVD